MTDSAAQAQFTQQFREIQPELLGYILALVPRHEDALEVLQETATALWRKYDQYDASRPFGAWARKFAHIQVHKHRERQQYRHWMVDAFDESLVEDLASEFENHAEVLQMRRDALADCLEKLSAADHQLLKQRYWQEVNLRALAKELGQSEHRLYRRLGQIRSGLEHCIDHGMARKEV